MQPMIVSPPDLNSSPGLRPCDRCELIVGCEWFDSFWLCEPCRARAEEANRHASDDIAETDDSRRRCIVLRGGLVG